MTAVLLVTAVLVFLLVLVLCDCGKKNEKEWRSFRSQPPSAASARHLASSLPPLASAPMILAVPGKVVEILGHDPLLRSAKVSFSGVIKQVSLTCTPEASVGDYVLVHVGVAISIVDQKEAEETYAYLKQMGELDGLEPGPVGGGAP